MGLTMTSKQIQSKEWLYEDFVLINEGGIQTLSSKRIIPSALKNLNQTLVAVFKELNETTLNRYNWSDVKTALVRKLLLPDYDELWKRRLRK